MSPTVPSTAGAQRAKLAKRLASRSDTLIMLSATPHDGRARSFASLMNMLDPTTLPDPGRYDKKDVRTPVRPPFQEGRDGRGVRQLPRSAR